MQNITSYSKNQNLIFDPNNVSDIFKLAESIKNSSLLPSIYRNNSANIITGMMVCLRLGLDPIMGLHELIIINDKVTMGVKAMLSLVIGHPDCEDFIESFDKENLIATCTIKRKNRTPVTCSFSKKDAEKAGLWGKPRSAWVSYPERMLINRARGWALNDCFGDIFKGVLPREEVEDYDNFKSPMKPVTKLNNTTETLESNLDRLYIEPYKESSIPLCNQDILKSLIKANNVSRDLVKKWLIKANVDDISNLDEEITSKCIDYINTHLIKTEDQDNEKTLNIKVQDKQLKEKLDNIANQIAEHIGDDNEITVISQVCQDLDYLIIEKNIDRQIVNKWLEKANVKDVLDLDDEIASKCIKYIEANY